MSQKNAAPPPFVSEYVINGTKYIVKSVFVGNQDLKTKLINLAEQKAVKAMGLDKPIS
jgi:hypothetical protein